MAQESEQGDTVNSAIQSDTAGAYTMVRHALPARAYLVPAYARRRACHRAPAHSGGGRDALRSGPDVPRRTNVEAF